MTRFPHTGQRKYRSDLMTCSLQCCHIFFLPLFFHWKPDCKLNCASERRRQMQCDSPPLRRTKTCLRSLWHRMQCLQFWIFLTDWTEYKCENCHARERERGKKWGKKNLKRTCHRVTLFDKRFKENNTQCYSHEALRAQVLKSSNLQGNFYWTVSTERALFPVLELSWDNMKQEP